MCHFALSFELQKVSQKENYFLNLADFSRRIRQERRHQADGSRACLEVGLYGKGKLIDEDLLESRDIVLLVEDEHGLLVVH